MRLGSMGLCGAKDGAVLYTVRHVTTTCSACDVGASPSNSTQRTCHISVHPVGMPRWTIP